METLVPSLHYPHARCSIATQTVEVYIIPLSAEGSVGVQWSGY